jgi:hypothetical protein
VLEPYTKSKAVWGCPADFGFEIGGRSETIPFDTRPSSFEKYGSSYYYNTNLVMHEDPVSALRAWQRDPPYAERGPSQVVVLYDGTGIWHGGYVWNTRRYASLFADGHARVLRRPEFDAAFRITFTRPQ